MKKIFYVAAIAALFASCAEEEKTLNDVISNEKNSFTATFESNETRAYLDNSDFCRWDENDRVSIFNNTGEHYTYHSTRGGVTTTKLVTDATPNFTDGNVYALFPYNSENSMANGVYTSAIPAEQVYNAEKASLNNAIMVASNLFEENSLSFKNSCALIKLNLMAPTGFENRFKVNSIKVESKANNLAGTVTIGEDLTAKISNGTSKSITMSGCAEAGYMTDEYKTFVLVIPAGTYAADDLTFTIDTDQDIFDYTTTLSQEVTVGRSKYITLNATLPGPVMTLEHTEYVDKAIMCHLHLVSAAGFTNQNKVEYEYEIPEHNLIIDGQGKTYNFTTTADDVFILNTFTSNSSGMKGVDYGSIFVKNLTITGELRSTCMGVYVRNTSEYAPYNNADNFYTEFTDVNILNNKIIPMTVDKVSGAKEDASSAVCVYGTAVLNNCNIYGSEPSEKALAIDSWKDIPVYDMTVVNSTGTTTINGGYIGKIRGKEHSDIYIKGDAKVDYIFTIAIITTDNNLGSLQIEDAQVGHIVMDPVGKYAPRLNVKSGAKIEKLEFIDDSNSTTYWANVNIEDGATINSVIVNGTEMTFEEFKTNYLN